jgi:hypothetical protein
VLQPALVCLNSSPGLHGKTPVCYCVGQILIKKGETAKAHLELKKFLEVAKADDPQPSDVQVRFDGVVGTLKCLTSGLAFLILY